MTTREQAVQALVALIAGAYAWTSGPTRRLRLWTDVPPSQRPACFIYEGGNNGYSWSISAEPKRELNIKIFVYVDAHDPNIIGASQLNAINDALDAALTPLGNDLFSGRLTLGGLVHSCQISGAVLKEPGDLDGDGLLMVPVKIILP